MWRDGTADLLNFTDITFDSLLGSEGSSPILWLIWLIPIAVFIFYGQRIQLHVTSRELGKGIEKLRGYRDDAKKDLIGYLDANFKTTGDAEKRVERFVEYFTIMPVDIDPAGIMPKIKHLVRSREDYTRAQVRTFCQSNDLYALSKVQTLLEIATSLHLMHKIVLHLFLTAKKQNNFPLILPLQMIFPFIMEQAEALKGAVAALKQGQPLGDGIGPMVVGRIMQNTQKRNIVFETVCAQTEFEGRGLSLLKAEGPMSTVGRLGDAIESLVAQKRPDIIITIDAALKLEGEPSASVAQGFGVAMGGIGTDRFQIEEIATKHGIPIYAIVVKQSIKEAITLMTKDIADKADEVESDLYGTIRENSTPGQSVLVAGVGNTLGVLQ